MAIKFLTTLFSARSQGMIFLTRLPNERGRGPHPQRMTRTCDVIEKFLEKYDAPGFAVYFCVNTLRWGAERRCKANLSELVCLHADLDFKHIVERGVDIKKALDRLLLRPQLINFSGHGWHCYWLFDQALPATWQNIGRVEAALKRLAHVVAGDPAVCEVARLMRLPGSHNSKNNEWIEVRTIGARAGSYTFEELEQWLGDAKPVLQRRSPANSRDPYAACAAKWGGEFKARIDVAQRFAEMIYGGPGESGIHNTQLSVTAALLSRGWDVNDVVWEVLEATMRVPGTEGFDWNEEEQTIRGLCESWLEKHPRQTLFFGFEEPILFEGREEPIILGGNDAQD